MGRVPLVASVVTMVLVVVGVAASPPAWGATNARIDGGGSSWAANGVNQWIADTTRRGLQVDYTATGSPTGRRDFASRVVDFAISDIPFQGTDPLTGESDTSRGRPFAYLPMVAGGTAFPYQIRVNGTLVRDLRLSGRTLAKIFTNQITNWSDPAVTTDNGGRVLPPLDITPVVHAEGSGATWQFTAYLASQFPADWGAFTSLPRATQYFPRQGRMIATDGSDGVMNTVSAGSNNGAIGYDEYSYALAVNYPVARVQNAAGLFTAPLPDNVTAALTRAVIDTDPRSPTYLTADLSRVYASPDPRAYPLSSYSYGILPTGTNAEDARMTTAKRQTLADFLTYGLCAGQGVLGVLGYAPLPANLVQAGLDQIRRLQAADPSVDLPGGATSCPSTAGVLVSGDNQTVPYQGTVALQVAGGTAVDLRQTDPGAPGGHPVQATDPTGHRHAWVFTGSLTGIAVSDTRPDQPGWTLTGQAADFVAGTTTVSSVHLGWTPALVAAASDAEGVPVAGPAVAPRMQVPTSDGLAEPGATLASAPAGSGLGTQRVSAAMALWIPDTAPTGTYTSTLTLTLISP